jgi:hypothetical protein
VNGGRSRACVLLLLPWLLAACGSNLLVARHQAELHLPSGATVPIELDWRIENGMLDLGEPISTALVGLLIEPFDWLASTSIAISSITDSDQHVVLGPLGWLAALTPFATLVPEFEFPPGYRQDIDDATLAKLRAGDVATARTVFGDRRITAVQCR